MNWRDFQELVPDDEELVAPEKEIAINEVKGEGNEEQIEAGDPGNGSDGVLISNKRQKIEEDAEGEDRISELPDPILLQILSLLPTTEEVIRTGILSKRWQYLWTTIPVLNFDNDKERSFTDFASFIDKTLIQCRHSKVERFKLHFGWGDDGELYETKVFSWIRYAVACKVEELDIRLSGKDDIFFYAPKYLLSHTGLTSLALRHVRIPPVGKITRNLLKSLLLKWVELSEEVMEMICSGCPVLETLKLECCSSVRRLNINSASVRRLVLERYVGSFEAIVDDWTLEISAPNITSLEVNEKVFVRDLVLLDLNSLVEAKVDFYSPSLMLRPPDDEDAAVANEEAAEELWMRLLKSLSHVNELTVGDWCLAVLCRFEAKLWRSAESTRKCLKLNCFVRRRGFLGLVNLLRSSPELETLLINADPPFSSMTPSAFHTRGNYLVWVSQFFHFRCQLRNLRTVKIDYLIEWDRECEVVEFLLRNARVLEKMVIQVRSLHSKQSTFGSQELLQVAQKLLGFPRASKDAVLRFSG